MEKGSALNLEAQDHNAIGGAFQEDELDPNSIEVRLNHAGGLKVTRTVI